MLYLNLGLSNISIDQLIKKSNGVSDKLTGNPHFLEPSPSISRIKSLAKNLDELNTLVDHGKSGVILQLQSQFRTLKNEMFLLGQYVAFESEGNSEIALSSGFEVSEKYCSHQDFVIDL